GEQGWTPPETLLLLNKVDRLADNRELLVWHQREPAAIPLCALPGPDGTPGLGQEELQQRVRRIGLGEEVELLLAVPLAESRTISALESQGVVSGREYENGEALLRVRIGERALERLMKQGSRLRAVQGALPARSSGGWGRG